MRKKITELYYFLITAFFTCPLINKSNKAINILERAINENKKNEYLYYLLSFIYSYTENAEKAIFYLHKVEEFANEYKEDIYYDLADLYGSETIKNYEKSNFYIDLCLNKNPKNGYLYFLKGKNNKELNKLNDSIENFEKAEALGYKREELFQNITFVFYKKGDIEKTLEYCNKGLKKYPFDSFLIKIKGSALNRQEKYEDGLKELVKALNIEGADSFTIEIIENSIKNIQDKNKAIKYLERNLKRKNQSSLYVIKGFLENENENFEKAIEYLLKAEQLGFEEDIFFEEISFTFNKINEKEKALKYIEKGLEKYPHNDYLYGLKGHIFYKNENFEEALKFFLKSEEQGSRNEILFKEIAHSYSKINNDEKAIEYIEKGLEKNQENGYLYALKGWIQKENEKYEDALPNLIKGEELGFEEEWIIEEIAHTYEKLNNHEKAFEYIEKGLNKNPNNAYLPALKGWILKKEEKYEQALPLLLKGEELGFSEEWLFVDIADIYKKLNNKEKTLEYAKKCLELYSNNSYAKNLINDIEEEIK